ncbi:hypothetical protein WMF27_38610 [Sorangium sp. So ce281]|uniref:hypothetical protein n=1 Tax=unclassified Sorangium TaxID=2621164 RepID=UPI003F610E88
MAERDRLGRATLIASTDVAAHVVRRLAPAREDEDEDEDFGHGDLLYAADAVDQAWAPLARWLLHHGSPAGSAPDPLNRRAPGCTTSELPRARHAR